MEILTLFTAVVTGLLLVYLFAALVRRSGFNLMLQLQVWILPLLILALTTVLAIPSSRYLAWLMDGKYRAAAPCAGSKAG